MGRLHRLGQAIPDCPLCDGSCRHELERSEYAIGGNMPRPVPGNRAENPKPDPVLPAKRRRARALHGPTEHRAYLSPGADR